MNIFFKHEIQISNKCLRTLDYKDDLLLVGCLDKKLYLVDTENMKIIRHFDFFDSEVYSVKFLSKDRIAIGCNDARIYITTMEGDLISALEGHTEKVNSLSCHGDFLASGSWDATCRVWDLSSYKEVSVLTGHTYAVTTCFLENGNLLTGSQNGELQLFSGQNFQLIKNIKAHSDIIRDIKYFDKKIATASNDCTVKLWTDELMELNELQGHSSFIFALGLVHNQLGYFIFSGGEDFKIKAFKENQEYGSIAYPTTLWGISGISKSDIATCGEDGKLRIFSLNQSNVDWAQHERYVEAAEVAGLKNPEISEEDLKRFPSIEQKDTIKGKKDGEVKVFVNNGKGEAYTWQNGKWEYLGEMLGAKPKTKYPGDRFFPAGDYDYVFSIEDESGVGKKLPFNKGDNTLLAAEKFLAREQLSLGYKEQIINFIKQNAAGHVEPKSTAQSTQDKPANTAPTKQLMQFPIVDLIFYDNINAEALNKKILEINNKYKETESDKQKSFSTSEMIAYNNLMSKLSNPATMQQNEIEGTEQHLISTKLISWTNLDAVPILDFLRIYVLHHRSEELFGSVDNGLKFFVFAISLAKYNEEKYFSLILRFFANVFKHNGLSFELNEPIILDFLNVKAPAFASKSKSLLLVVYNNYLSYLIEKNKHRSIKALFEVLCSLDWNFIKGNDFDTTNYLIAVGNSIIFNEPAVIELCKQQISFVESLHTSQNEALKQDILAYFKKE